MLVAGANPITTILDPGWAKSDPNSLVRDILPISTCGSGFYPESRAGAARNYLKAGILTFGTKKKS
jgi:hypothetical protein